MSSLNALLPINTSGLASLPREIGVDERHRELSGDARHPTTGLPEAETDHLTNSPTTAQITDRVLLPEEAMNATLPQVSSSLDGALLAFAAGQTDQGCARLEEAAGLLDSLIAAVIPAATNESTMAEAPRAMAAAA